MSPDDTTPPTDTGKTQADTLDPGPPDRRCLYIKLPLLAEVPLEVTQDPDQIAGLCALLETAAQDFLRSHIHTSGEILFNPLGVQVAYDDGLSPDYVAFPQNLP